MLDCFLDLSKVLFLDSGKFILSKSLGVVFLFT